MIDMAKPALLLAFITALTACGGSSGSDDPKPTTGDNNRAPTLTLSTTEIDLPTGGEASFSYEASDPDGDPITVTLKSSDPRVQASAAEGVITLQSEKGAEQHSGTITVTVSDGDLSTSAEAQYTLWDYLAFSLELTEEAQDQNWLIQPGASISVPLAFQPGTVDPADLSLSVIMARSVDTETPVQSSIGVDLTKGTMEVQAPFGEPDSYLVTLTADDGVTERVLHWSFQLANNSLLPIPDLARIEYIPANGSRTLAITSDNSAYPETFRLQSQSSISITSGDPNLLDISISADGKSFTVTALPGAENKHFTYWPVTTDASGVEASAEYYFYVTAETGPLEQALIQDINDTRAYIQASSELEYLGLFLLDLQSVAGHLTPGQHQLERDRIYDRRHSLHRSLMAEINCMEDAAVYGLVRQHSGSTAICSFGERNLEDAGTGDTSGNHYADPQNQAAALERLETIRYLASEIMVLDSGYTLEEHVNALVDQTKTLYPALQVGHVSWVPLQEYSPGRYSRLVGNNDYGTYIDGSWVFDPGYRDLRIATAKANGSIHY
ncbi:hypothetical protein [Ferrimonas marina]|uniref:Ig-like domain (Group 2) n=1 Tax=Ferrimonas marina TaxID=299255 RepID=A0A1M5T6D9_9GAMM|nr:hypothetical protein [Ferrimonas marina]SHH46315.1 hypothetical protein SAMN02745129_2019 [Ferrimonas marina]